MHQRPNCASAQRNHGEGLSPISPQISASKLSQNCLCLESKIMRAWKDATDCVHYTMSCMIVSFCQVEFTWFLGSKYCNLAKPQFSGSRNTQLS